MNTQTIILIIAVIIFLWIFGNNMNVEGLSVVERSRKYRPRRWRNRRRYRYRPNRYRTNYCRGSCEGRSPIYQRNGNLNKCLNCRNCGLCQYSNGAMECMPGNVYGPTEYGFDPNNCTCWYHGQASGCWPYSTYSNYDSYGTYVNRYPSWLRRDRRRRRRTSRSGRRSSST